MITDGKNWQYLFVKKFSAMLKVISSKFVADFYCFIVFIVFIDIQQKINLSSLKKCAKITIILM